MEISESILTGTITDVIENEKTLKRFIKQFQLDNEKYNFKELPKELMISTMTIVCKTKVLFNIENINKELKLDENKILSIKCNGKERTLIKSTRKRKMKIQKEKKNFYNQVSICVKINDNKNVNIKLFINGSIQITGSKTFEHVVIGITKLFDEIRNKKYVDNLDELYIDKIFDFKIAMINSNFKIGFEIEREKLYYLIKKNTKYVCVYDPNYHACVDIKFEIDDKIVSIFVFESGSIVITGARNCSHITNSYNFIYEFLIENYLILVKNKYIMTKPEINIIDYLKI